MLTPSRRIYTLQCIWKMNKYVIQQEYVVAVVCYSEIGYGMNMINVGPLTGGPQCRVSNLRNGNVPCRYLCISHVDFKIV